MPQYQNKTENMKIQIIWQVWKKLIKKRGKNDEFQ
jgi:hypothetical protein